MMNSADKTKAVIRWASVIMILIAIGSLIGCAGSNGFVGEYVGTAGSYLKLQENGSCIYAEDDETGTGMGSWYIEEDVLYVEVNNLNYPIYADITYSEDGLLMKSEWFHWQDEFFVKQS